MKIRKGIIFLVVMVLAAAEASAQTPPPDPSHYGAPLDGFSIVLVLTGAAYGVIRMNRNKN